MCHFFEAVLIKPTLLEPSEVATIVQTAMDTTKGDKLTAAKLALRKIGVQPQNMTAFLVAASPYLRQ